jgi:hypothetical protein
MPCLYDYIYSKGTDPPDEDQHGHAEATLTEKRRHCGRCLAFGWLSLLSFWLSL